MNKNRPARPSRLKRDLIRNKYLYLMVIPVVVYYLIFNYLPMYGISIAFMDFKPRLGFAGSNWVGLDNLQQFFDSIYFGRLVRNTLTLSIYGLVFGFPIPIIFAILLNELTNLRFKKVVQTVTYLPHFITTVVIASLVIMFTNADGFITQIADTLGGSGSSLIGDPKYFRSIYTISGIWQGFGWGSIIYLAAITGISGELFEAATIDGANKLRRIWHITLPGILPTIVIMLILSIGGMMSVGWEKAFLLQVPATFETSDIVSTYVYRKGFQDMDYSFSTAVDLFNSGINVILLAVSNFISRKVTDSSLW